jgi:hypothetical protein
VFVDSSGQRNRKLRRLGWILGSACACYAAVLVFSLVGGDVDAPWLLIPGQDDDAPGRMVVTSPDERATAKPGDLPGLTPGAIVPVGSGALPGHGKARRDKPSWQPASGARGAEPAASDRHGGRADSSPTGPKFPTAADPGTGPDTGTDPGTGPGTSADPSADPGASPDTGTDPSTDASPDPSTAADPSTNPGTGPDTGTDPSTAPGTGPDTGSDPSPGPSVSTGTPPSPATTPTTSASAQPTQDKGAE